jgi:hypothetical protein
MKHYRLYLLLSRILLKTPVHFIHIGKTGGTSIIAGLKIESSPNLGRKYVVFSHFHDFGLKDVGRGEKIFFCVRDPIEKFISGFYSRQRKGRPRYSKEWSIGEQHAFERFSTPNQLALALSSDNQEDRNEAVLAMKTIVHVSASYWDWFVDEKYFESRLGDVLFVCQIERLDSDFEKLKQLLRLPSGLSLPKNEVERHENPKGLDKHLDDRAVQNLKKWYERDYQFIECLKKNGLI